MTRPLFEFDLTPVEQIDPWEKDGTPFLSWYALTHGTFRLNAGADVLFRYSDAIQQHWKGRVDADYQVAAFARDMLSPLAAALTPLPPFFEQLAADPQYLERLREADAESEAEVYAAMRWLGERSPWTNYLVASPDIRFLRVGDDLQIQWDNRDCVVEDLPVWAAMQGSWTLPVSAFVAECHSLVDRLLAAMDARLLTIESGAAKPQVPIDPGLLREQHEIWRNELNSAFDRPYAADVPWAEAEAAIRAIAKGSEISLPG